ncbi:pre-peptidase C-terminal domain-containing protein [Lachnospiraceae bacterium HCP1S3_C3]
MGIILHLLIGLSILFGLYKIVIDDQKNLGYISFIFGVLTYLVTLIPTSTGEVPSNEEQTIEFEDKESEVEDNSIKESIKVGISKEETSRQSIENIIQETELESNNTIEESNGIEVNRQYWGKLASDEDVDYYKFKIENAGKISITFQHSKIDNGDRLWEIYLIDSKTDNEIIQFNSVGGTTNGESDVARIPAGEYYVRVNSYYYSDKDYMFKVNFSEESDLYEKEPNDQIDIANNININTNYSGNLQSDRDVDYYKFSIENKGKINISFEHEKIDSGDRLWEVYLLDGVSDNTIITLFSSGREAILQSDCARIPPGDYYLKINSYDYSNKDYNFTVNFESESEQYESENNNEFSLANDLTMGKKYIGNIQTDNDVDYYCFTVTETRNISVRFEHDMIDANNLYWEVYVINGVDDKNVLQMNIKGTESSISATAENIEPGMYYIKVNSYDFNNTDYTILVE